MSGEPASSSLGISFLLKTYGAKVLAGAIATALMFAVLWPKTKREGVMRIGCTIAGSMLGGEVLLAWVRSAFSWFPAGMEPAMLVYVAAGLPAWWLLGGVARWFDRRKRRDIGEMAADAAGTIKGLRGDPP